MFKFLLLSFGLIFINPLLSQEADLQWTESLDFSKDAEYTQIIGSRYGHVYTISSSNPDPKNSVDVWLNIYDKKNFQKTVSLEIINSKSDINYEDLVISRNYVLLFTSYYDRNLGFKILTTQTYDISTNSLSEPERIDEVLSTSKAEFNPFQITCSQDGSYILIYHNNPSQTGNRVFNMKVISEDFTSMWEKEIELNYKERMVNYVDLILNNNTTVYLLTSINPYGIDRSSGFGNLLNLKNTLFTYNPYQDKLREFEFALTKNWINSVIMDVDINQNLVASAFYTYPNDYKIRGLIQFKIDGETGEVLMKKMTALDKEQYKSIERSIDKLKDYSRLSLGATGIYPGSSGHMNNTSTEFVLKDIHSTSSSDVVVVEALRRDERCTESFNEQQMIVNCEKHYLYGNIILFFMDLDGSVRRIETIEKMQHSIDRPNPYFSFKSYCSDNKLLICYNDDYQNFPESGETSDSKKNALTKLSRAKINVLAYSAVGSPAPLSLNRGDETGVLYFPTQTQWLTPSELLLYSQKEKNYKFGTLLIR